MSVTKSGLPRRGTWPYIATIIAVVRCLNTDGTFETIAPKVGCSARTLRSRVAEAGFRQLNGKWTAA